jgi:small subunit ribosomal protein S20
LRDIRVAIDAGDSAKAKDALRETISLVDKMAGKGVIHRNAAARYKSRLAGRVSRKSAAA